MDKTILRNVLSTLQPNQHVLIQVRGAPASEQYVVIEVKRGRGKHGSLIANLQSVNTGAALHIGTAKNLDILNITVNDIFYGVLTERDEPTPYPTNVAQSVNLKTVLKVALEQANIDRRASRVRFESNIPEYNGVFFVVKHQNEKGKHGQLHLWLVPEGQLQSPENTLELWSYRHSGIIQGFEVLPASV